MQTVCNKHTFSKWYAYWDKEMIIWTMLLDITQKALEHFHLVNLQTISISKSNHKHKENDFEDKTLTIINLYFKIQIDFITHFSTKKMKLVN